MAPVLFISSQQAQSPPVVNANSYTSNCFKCKTKKHIFSHLEPPALQNYTYQLALDKTNPGAIKDPQTADPETPQCAAELGHLDM